jgi:hypothetical protein
MEQLRIDRHALGAIILSGVNAAFLRTPNGAC